MQDLWDLIQRRSAEAHANGALYRIESTPHCIADGGIEFVVRQAVDYQRQSATMPRSRPGNPFLPPEPELFLANVSGTHYALLNKYHVIDNHLLVVTREFVDQSAVLDLPDFEALVACMPSHAPCIAFYNGGHGSGASQPHKHLQVVTLPLSAHAAMPLAPRIEDRARPLPFRHAFAPLASHEPALLLETYRRLLLEAGLELLPEGGIERPSGAYNLLVTAKWMLLVPRSRPDFEGVAVNSLAYAGAMFVRREPQMQALRAAGPMSVLEHTGFPARG